MNRQEAREAVNQMDITSIYPFQKYKGYMYCCPVCGSGTGNNKKKTGALQIREGRKIRCYANECFSEKGEDNVGALRIIWKCSEDEVFAKVLGDNWQGKDFSLQAKKKKEEPKAEAELTKKQALDEWLKQTKAYIAKSIDAMKEGPAAALDYLQGVRGITKESIDKFELGYDPAMNMIVLPYNKAHTYYEGRFISPSANVVHHYPVHEYQGITVGIRKPIFNVGALHTKDRKPVFVVESILCAISIMQCTFGTMAVATGGTGGVDALVQTITEREAKDIVFILCLDNDEPGRKAQKKLSEKLSELGVKFVEFNIAGEATDPNEALMKDEGGLIERIYEALDIANEEREARKEEYIQQNSNREPLLQFMQKVNKPAGCSYISTGIQGLDKMLEGGLYPGLYVVGAISSLGKTTLCMQIMDSIAAAGKDALIFSLEMDKEELMSKSVSRHTFQRATDENEWEKAVRLAKTCRGISDGSRYDDYSDKEIELIKNSVVDYGKYANRVFVVEGMGDIGVTEIRTKISEHISITGRKPVVLVDYLQILAPYKDPEAPTRSLTDKQAVDKNVLELKRISRDYGLPVVAVSSLNRANYNTTTNMAAFKESGAIEYSADVLIGLEYNGIKDSELEDIIEKNNDKTEAGDAIEIKLKILKQRAGARGASCILDYFPMFNAFVEKGQEMEKPREQQTSFTDVTDSIDVPF